MRPLLEEDEVALILAEQYVVEAQRLLADHLAKIARLRSQGRKTSEAEQALRSVEAFLTVIDRHIDLLLQQQKEG